MSDASLRPRINITIDCLVLKGFPSSARGAVTAAFHAELRRLTATEGLSFGGSRAASQLRTAPLRLGPRASPTAMAAAAARELLRGLCQ